MSSEIQDYLLLSLNEEEKLLHSKWLRTVTSAEYRKSIIAMKDLILQHQVELWLIDSRLLEAVLFADQQWIKRVIASLIKYSSLQRVARVLTDDVFNYISFENMIQKVKEEYEAAFDWLRMEQL